MATEYKVVTNFKNSVRVKVDLETSKPVEIVSEDEVLSDSELNSERFDFDYYTPEQAAFAAEADYRKDKPNLFLEEGLIEIVVVKVF
jgi:hypothetical protein